MRNEIINKINNLFDENIDLKIQNEYLKSTLEKKEVCREAKEEPNTQLSDLDTKVLEYGRKKLYSAIAPSSYVDVTRKDNGEIKTTTFTDWVMDAISSYNLPNNFSKEDIANIYDKELKEEYQKRKANAIKDFEKEEAKGE